MKQTRVQKQSSKQEIKEIQELPAKTEQRDTSDIDELLDEIDSVLEENAQEFVQGYIQKGGE